MVKDEAQHYQHEFFAQLIISRKPWLIAFGAWGFWAVLGHFKLESHLSSKPVILDFGSNLAIK